MGSIFIEGLYFDTPPNGKISVLVLRPTMKIFVTVMLMSHIWHSAKLIACAKTVEKSLKDSVHSSV